MKLQGALLVSTILGISSPAILAAQEMPPPSTAATQYSPYPKASYPDSVFFGDTHLHTSYSADAGMAGAFVGPEDAYR
jgi:hypothetical protein